MSLIVIPLAAFVGMPFGSSIRVPDTGRHHIIPEGISSGFLDELVAGGRINRDLFNDNIIVLPTGDGNATNLAPHRGGHVDDYFSQVERTLADELAPISTGHLGMRKEA